MVVVELKLPHHRYEIRIEPGLLRSVGDSIRRVAPHDRAALVSDARVRATHGQLVVESIEAAGYDLLTAEVDGREEEKNLDTVRRLYERLLDVRLERRSPVVTLGGGVVGDTAGFVAATYLRGVPLIQCPTTLLAMVDASVGGKVGVNMPHGKNLVGAFHQPSLVVIDTDTLGTLPPRALRCGLAECVKHGMIRDPALFDWIDDHLDAILALDSAALVDLVRRNVQIKADVVVADERESNVRAHLNLGHTFGHAIEAMQGYDSTHGYHHGEAVALGMVAATRFAVDGGHCETGVLDRLEALLTRIGLPTRAERIGPIDRLVDAMRLDKKSRDGKVRLVLPERIGAATILGDAPPASITRAWEAIVLNRP